MKGWELVGRTNSGWIRGFYYHSRYDGEMENHQQPLMFQLELGRVRGWRSPYLTMGSPNQNNYHICHAGFPFEDLFLSAIRPARSAAETYK